MKGYYLRVSPEVLDQVASRPAKLEKLLSTTMKTAPSNARQLSVENSWHAIHYLLNGNGGCGISPLSDAVMGGTPIGSEEFGYGPPRGLTAGEVRNVALALAKISSAKLLLRYDAAAMNEAEIHPHNWEDSVKDRNTVAEHFTKLAMFFKHASDAGDALILYIV